MMLEMSSSSVLDASIWAGERLHSAGFTTKRMSYTYRLGQLEDGLASRQCRLVIISDFYIDDVHGTIELAIPGEEILTNGIEAALFAGNDNVCNVAALLKAFWCRLYTTIPIKHRQQTIGRVTGGKQGWEWTSEGVQAFMAFKNPSQPRILLRKVLIDGVKRRSKRVDVWPICCWAGQPDSATCAR